MNLLPLKTVLRRRLSLPLLLIAGLWLLPDARADDRLQVCAACHATGAGGAPRMGRAQEWVPHLKKGMPALIRSVRLGVPGTLMASDVCDGCTNTEIEKLIRRMSVAPHHNP